MKTKANNKKINKKKVAKSEVAIAKQSKKIILVTLFLGVLAGSIYQINFDTLLPIKKIRAQGEFENVTEKMILDAISDDVEGGYLSVNVRQLQHKIERLAWVKQASVRRVWPDSVVVTIKEQKAYAIWMNKGLLNNLGERFEPEIIAALKLPVLSGPENLNVKVMDIYKNFKRQLGAIGLTVIELTLDNRRAIYLELSNNIKISIGRSDYQSRLIRFITAYKINLNKYSNKIDYVDMRYTNGFSIKWKENTQAAHAENVLMGVRYV